MVPRSSYRQLSDPHPGSLTNSSPTCAQSCHTKLQYTRHCLFRVKHLRRVSVAGTETDLARVLTTFDLTHLGVGSILGAGIYVVTGQVAMNIAGPSIVISFMIAAFASLLSGLCYAEFGSRVPHTTGSAYAYSYHTVGEFIAFVIGWNLILEYMIGTAADARALGSAIDYLLDRRIENFSLATFGTIPHLGTYPDLLGFLVTIAVTIILALGVKESARYTALFNFLNGGIAILVIVLGSIKANTMYWSGTETFFPNGAHGVFAGAAACFYAFVGFDIIATTGEEARTASKSIPTAVALTLVICCSLYLGVSTVLTMMVPFKGLVTSSPLTEAFDHTGLTWAKWVIGSGAVFGLCASLMGSEFPLPRIIYAMAVDGLLFKWLRHVWERTETPVIATLVPGFMTAIFAMLFDLRELVEMMSIGTLLAYSLVCTSILLLRYRPSHSPRWIRLTYRPDSRDGVDMDITPLLHDEHPNSRTTFLSDGDATNDECATSAMGGYQEGAPGNRCCSGLGNVIPCMHEEMAMHRLPTEYTARLVTYATVSLWILSGCVSCLMVFAENQIMHSPGLIVLLVLFVTGIVICLILVTWQPQDRITLRDLHFSVPLVPLLPMTAIVINVFLMVRLSQLTWIRFAVWMAIGLVIYFAYGMWHSEEAAHHVHQRPPGTDAEPHDESQSSTPPTADQGQPTISNGNTYHHVDNSCDTAPHGTNTEKDASTTAAAEDGSDFFLVPLTESTNKK